MNKIKKFVSFITGYWTHVFCLSLIVIGMPFSKFLMSLGTIALIANWFLEGNVREKFNVFFNNKIAVVSTGVFFIFVLGLIHTQNFEYGIKDLRIKLPLLAFPIVFSSTHRLKKNHYFLIVKFFVLAVIASSLYGFLVYKDLVPAKKQITELRDISQFISHIRLSLMIVLSLFLIPKLFNQIIYQKAFGLISGLFLLYFLSFMESATGLVIGLITLFLASLYYLFKKKSWYGFVMLMPIVIGGVFVFINLYSTYNSVKIDTSKMDLVTKSGNPYIQDYPYQFFDNGNYAQDYVNLEELEVAWQKRSKVPFNGNETIKGCKFILIRYLTSKGLRKDKEGVEALTENDIENIENGIPNYLHTSTNMLARLHLLMFEIDGHLKGVNANGNSLAQRLEYWRISNEIIQKKPIFGYGTGDLADVFKEKYALIDNGLKEKYQLRSHNQYLSVTIALGIFGLVFFLFFIVYPVGFAFRQRNYFYLICLCISLLSFFSEDTLETQDGVFFFAFLSFFFLFSSQNRYLKSVD